MKAIVPTAHRYNRKVTAHATSNLAVWAAVMAGVDGIEHGYQIAGTTLQLMVQKGIPLIPTDGSGKAITAYLQISGYEGNIEQAISNYRAGMSDRLNRAIKAGVTIVAGSDMYIDLDMPQGEAAKDLLVAYHESGMPPLHILTAATHHSARFMGLENRLGVIKENAYADLIALEGDIEDNFQEALFHVVFVMKDGVIYKGGR